MKIANTVKKFGKPIIGVVAGLAIAGASVLSALKSDDSVDDDYDEEWTDEDNETESEDSEQPTEEATDEPE